MAEKKYPDALNQHHPTLTAKLVLEAWNLNKTHTHALYTKTNRAYIITRDINTTYTSSIIPPSKLREIRTSTALFV
ncbi:predicted protein [Botrytis cinerea T4]|uniref:Uncharacterized protein n=1 Tax=Botryotinia fuckeliana (strain T4) TaxID=999810 RepID=G2Y735_BOTF4|nr:predicted protein [Botrytis cinerea T4]